MCSQWRTWLWRAPRAANSEQNIRNGCDKLKAARIGKQQVRMDSFFKVLPKAADAKGVKRKSDPKGAKGKAGYGKKAKVRLSFPFPFSYFLGKRVARRNAWVGCNTDVGRCAMFTGASASPRPMLHKALLKLCGRGSWSQPSRS